jgi:hypothetical protein
MVQCRTDPIAGVGLGGSEREPPPRPQTRDRAGPGASTDTELEKLKERLQIPRVWSLRRGPTHGTTPASALCLDVNPIHQRSL